MRLLPGLALAAAAAASSAAAEDWRFTGDPERRHGEAFVASPAASGAPLLSLSCTLAGYDPALAGDAAEAIRETAPGTLWLAVEGANFPSARQRAEADAGQPARTLRFLIDGKLHRAEGAGYDFVNAEFGALVDAASPLVAALAGGGGVEISIPDSDGGISDGLAGASDAIAALLEFCASPAPEPDQPSQEAQPDQTSETVPPSQPEQMSEAEEADEAEEATEPDQPSQAERRTDRPGRARRPGEAPQEAAAAFPEAVSLLWFESDAGAREALLFAYVPTGGNSVSLEASLWVHDGGGWREAGRVRDAYGSDPRRVRFGPNVVAYTATMPQAGDPRCCPTGEARFRINRKTLKAREVKE